MATVWLISDTHFGHASMLTFTGLDGERIRPFSSVEEMDEHIVASWNRVVSKRDVTYHLGDVSMGLASLRHVKRLNGTKYLVRGNHDTGAARSYLDAGFQNIFGMKLLGGDLVLTHAPVHPGAIRARFLGNVHGHIHERPSPPGRYLNVSVEPLNYTPISVEEAQRRLTEKAHDSPMDPMFVSSLQDMELVMLRREAVQYGDSALKQQLDVELQSRAKKKA